MPNTTNPSSSSFGPVNNGPSLVQVYSQSMRNCDTAVQEQRTTFGSLGSACFFLTVYSLGVLLQLCILPANFRLAKHRCAFLLLLHINLLDLLWLLQYIWLCAEFLLLGRRLIVPLALDAYLFRLVNFCIDALYIQLAMNRAMAVLDGQGSLFERLFNKKNNRVYLVCTGFFGILYSIYTNWHPTRRPFHCLSQLGYFEPAASIPKQLLASLPDTFFYDGLQQIYMVVIYIPVFLYIAAFGKLFYEFLWRRFAASHSVSIGPKMFLHGSTKAPSPSSSSSPASSHAQFAHIALERSRLFLLCFFSQLPYLLANGLYHLSRLLQMDGQAVLVMAIFWQFFGTIFHVQQPLLMLLLSKEMWREVNTDMAWMFKQFRRRIWH